jgi:hypothetical protein
MNFKRAVIVILRLRYILVKKKNKLNITAYSEVHENLVSM